MVDLERWPLVVAQPPSAEPKSIAPKSIAPKSIAPKLIAPKPAEPMSIAPKPAEPRTAESRAGRADDSAAIEEFYSGLEQVLARRRPFVVMFDVRGAKPLSACRERLVSWTNIHDSSIRPHLIALAVVVASEVERADVTTAFWNLNQSYHARIFDDASEAERWLLAEFARGEGAN